MRKRIDLSLILPCYREEAIFEESVEKIIEVLKNSRLRFEILFVDDKSPDKTIHLIRKACKKYSFCKVLSHSINSGRGRAVSDGINAAKGTVVGYIDIDLEVSPVYVPYLTSLVLNGTADVVIGKRVYRTSPFSIPRAIMSIGYQLISRSILDTGGVDTESGYKFFNRKKILPVLAKTKHPHWFWDTEIMVRAKRANLGIVEVPVLFIRRHDKQSTVRTVRDIVDYLASLWKFNKQLSAENMKNRG